MITTVRASPGWFGAVGGFGAPLVCGGIGAEPGRGAPPVSGWLGADAGFGAPLVCGGFGADAGFGAPLVCGGFGADAGFGALPVCGGFGAEPGRGAPPDSRCFDADLLSISVVSASAPVVRLGADAPAPVRADRLPTSSIGAFARPGPAGPEGAAPLTPGALEAAEPADGDGFWLPAGVAPGRPDWGCSAAGACDLPAPPGAEPEGGGVFWLPAGVAPGRPGWCCVAAGGFCLPTLPGAPEAAAPAGLGAELGDGVFASDAGPEDGVPSEVVPLALGAADSLRTPAAGGFEEAGRAAEPVRLSGVTSFAPPAAGEGGCPDPALWPDPAFCAVPAGMEPPGLWAEAGEFDWPAGPFADFAPPAFDGASVLLDEVGPLPGSADARAACAPGTEPPDPAFGLAADAPRPEDGPAPAGAASGRCALAMRSVGAADAAGPLLSAAGVRSVPAPGRASAPAASAGSALLGAGFFSSFGSDTHTPRQSGTV
ncbi:hypothetical protein U3653_00545 [Nocardia sp. CDC186]|uniref:Uncharacterized protein n=1 Tax=Nocardia implantans TaxID=3108168 RepID=A0ABU6AM09_9NOCA|nr:MULTISPECIES: hypothetical protein [unclassified Nocardia]MBF6193397.1 hypothetical protein [Nocardia beijingensis]MEA3532690.1 hypothetical protein [Nocardia sp. CDC192]MEB3508498.1 hypothetical protein [Nocardia sp. CDC186]